MTSTVPPSTTATGRPGPALGRSALSPWRRAVDLAASGGMVLAVLIAFVPLGLVCYTVLTRGAGVMSLDFLTQDIQNSPRRAGGGMAPAIVGTLLITGMAAAIAIPVGVLGAVYLNEYGRQKPLARTIRMMADVMTGVPSIVMGLFVYIVWVTTFDEQTGFAGSLALACLMLPVVLRSSEEMLRLVPDELRQASLALGAPRWRTTVSVVLPAAISGITSGSLLAVARAAGETAPLVVTIGLVNTVNPNLFDGANTALSMQIFRNASQPFAAANDRAWGAALTLVGLVLVFTIVARLISNRFATRQR